MLSELERACLEAHLEGAPPPTVGADSSPQAWAEFALRLALSSGAMVRRQRRVVGRDDVSHKLDGSPATEVEAAVEARLRSWLAPTCGVQVAGEETGGRLPASGTAVAIDPIDGTRAFLAETETWATTITVFRDRRVVVALIANPATGEVAWVTDSDTRLLQLPVFGEPSSSCSLREHHPQAPRQPLVHLHPSRGAERLMTKLYAAWRERRLGMVRSAGGSPAWFLVEAARGHFAYVNLWARTPAEPWDLAAGVEAVRSAGGDVVTPDGRPIDPVGHVGPFIAAIDPAVREAVAELVSS